MADYEALGRAVKERRIQLGMSQLDVSQRGGPSTTTVSRIELGRLPNISQDTLLKLDNALAWRSGSSALVLEGGKPDKPDAETAIRHVNKQAAVRISGGMFDLLEPDEVAEVRSLAEAVARQRAREILRARYLFGESTFGRASTPAVPADAPVSPGVAYQQEVDEKLRELAQSDYVPAASPDRRQDGNGDAGEHDQEPEHP